MRLSQEQGNAAVLDHVGQSFFRVFRVQRHISTAGLEDRQQADDHFQAALDGDADQYLRTDAQGDQLVSQLVGALIQFAVAQLLLAHAQGWGIGGGTHLLFDQPVHGSVQRVCGGGGVPLRNDLPLLLAIEQRQTGNRGLRIGDDTLQQVQPMARHALDTAVLEQVTGVDQCR
ncbi:hypothetical protein D3C78_666840 [compost metagenome]